MRILISNDDGISAEGIYALAKTFSKENEVTVCAPDIERSASSHSLSVYSPIRIKKYDMGLPLTAYSCNGTPSDCVLFALSELMDEKPDLVISGINAGGNLSQDVLYSGTVSAAFEGSVLDVRSIAISLVSPNKASSYFPAAEFLYDFLNKNGIDILEKGTVLNVNVPPSDCYNGYKFCKLEQYPYNLCYEKRQDTYGRDYYWISSGLPDPKKINEGSDIYYIQQEYVTLTPLRYNLTDEILLKKLKESE